MNRLRHPLLCEAIVLLVVVANCRLGWAWGPHSEITAAALAVLPERDQLKKLLADDWDRQARDYCWMGDWQEAVRPDHYADDYLLFPGMPAHVNHMLPDVRQTYAPFFRRALQAVRTESPRNAARWIGSLLHFIQDSGSPPHTTGIVGELHGKMEQWVDEKQISIAGYEPRLLGDTDELALRGFLARMDELIDFSRQRAEKLKPILEKITQRENQPLELESALETARVSADILHTLYTLGLSPPDQPGCTLEGTLDYRPPAGYAAVPAKVMLAGTTYSTTADVEGSFRFHNLPAGQYTVHVLATGCESRTIENVVLRTDESTRMNLRLSPDPVAGNLIRNPKFALSWVKPGRPDGWVRDPRNPAQWSAALVRVPVGQRMNVAIEFQNDKMALVALRWRNNPATTGGSRELPLDLDPPDTEGRRSATVTTPENLEPLERGFLYLEILVATESPIDDVCRHVAVTFEKP